MKRLTTIFFLCTIISCTTNNEDDYFGSICDSQDVYYIGSDPNKSINKIVESKCLGCHLQGNTISYLSLETYEDLIVWDLDNIINDLENPMPPKGLSPLTDCEKEQIESWVQNGFRYD